MRVLVVAEHRTDRKCLGQMLANEGDFEVVGEAGDARLALPLVCARRPDVLVMTLPVAHAREATRLLAAEFPSVRVIGVSIDESLDLVPLLDAGAVACLRDSDSSDVLFAAIRYCAPG